MKPKIGITMGDPAGIGPEVVLKSLSDPGLSSLYQPILIGVPQVFERVSEDLKLAIELSLLNNVASELPIRVSGGSKVDSTLLSSQGRLDSLLVPRRLDSRDSIREGRFDRPRRRRIPIIPCGELKGPAGRKPSAEGGESSFLAIKLATELALHGKIDAVVTAPISKYSLHLADHAYPGHTELLSYLTKTERYAMMLLSGDYRVVLVTTHLALKQVAEVITEETVFDVIELTNSALKESFELNEPRIGVCSLNPHGGEGGIFGDEEERAIYPAVLRARREGIRVDGPHPSDTLFTRWQAFDSIVAMYHDQGLIPLKLLGFGKGVNLTIGLPFVRTSPDHGTAFDIAGKGVADPGSMMEALKLAAELSTRG